MNRDAYAYFPRSIVDFLDPEGLKHIMEESGLKDIRIYSLTFGIATVHIGSK